MIAAQSAADLALRLKNATHQPCLHRKPTIFTIIGLRKALERFQQTELAPFR